MNKTNTKKSEAAALDLEAVTIDLKNVSNGDLELIYGQPAEEVCRQLNETNSMSGAVAETVVRRVWKCDECGQEFDTAEEGIKHFQEGRCV